MQATILVRRGTLQTGALVVAGTASCKVRSLRDQSGGTIKAAGPSLPVEVMGWETLPMVGDLVLQLPTEKRLREVVGYRTSQSHASELAASRTDVAAQQKLASSLRAKVREQEQVRKGGNRRDRVQKFRQNAVDSANAELAAELPELTVVLKTDVVGSEEAICAMLAESPRPEVALTLVRSGVGEVTASDVETAELTGATIYSFNLPRCPRPIEDLADRAGVAIVRYDVIYELMTSVEEAAKALVPAVPVEVGRAVVLQRFELSGSKRAVVVGDALFPCHVTPFSRAT
jgi:translation initiation factor IF-2